MPPVCLFNKLQRLQITDLKYVTIVFENHDFETEI